MLQSRLTTKRVMCRRGWGWGKCDTGIGGMAAVVFGPGNPVGLVTTLVPALQATGIGVVLAD
ncbi:MAG: hypothetical protein WCS20_08515 [Alphaproteobacteria bacterium]